MRARVCGFNHLNHIKYDTYSHITIIIITLLSQKHFAIEEFASELSK